MKVYIYRYGSICEPDIIDTFNRLGFEVVEETIEMTKKDMLPAECISYVSPKLLDGGFSFVFSINFFPWLSDTCQVMKLRYMTLVVDSPVLELYSKSLANSCNRVFLFDKALYDEFAPTNPDGVFHIPLCTNVLRNDSVIAQNTHRDSYKSDISFVGSTYEEKCSYNRAKLPDYYRGYADGVIESQLLIYGYNFIEEVIDDDFVKTFLECTPGSYRFPPEYNGNDRAVVAQLYMSVKVAEQERLRALKLLSNSFNVDIYTGSDVSGIPHIHNRGYAKSLTEMPVIFNQSRINLNITAKSIRSGLPLRIFDVLGSGGFLITNYQSELSEFFDIGKDLVAYDSMEDLYDKCAYYLAHDQERQEIAANGYEKVKRLHTYDIRLLQMIDLAFK